MRFSIRGTCLLACLSIVGFLSSVNSMEAATYYVATNGRDTNTGSQASPWLTIGHAAGAMHAGDIVRVQSGTYNERVAIRTGGASGSPITYLADGQVICRGFDLTGVNYVRIIAFEITHINTSYQRGITMNGACAHIDIIDNYIHNIYGSQGITGNSSGCYPSYITIRGNKLFELGIIHGVITNSPPVGISSCFVSPHHWLVEYNTLQRCGDFMDIFGTNIVCRNNFMHDYRNSYWNATDSSWHSDMFQPGSDGVAVGTRHHIYERNFCGDSTEANSHFGIWQDTVNAGDTNILIRGNVAFNFGSGGVGVIGVDKVQCYNNTFYSLGSSGFTYYKGGSLNQPPTLGLIADNVVHTAVGADAIYVESASDATKTHNLGYSAGSDASYVSTGNPLFIDSTSATRNFRLQLGSPAINAGTNVVWVTSGTGNGTTFNVNDGQRLFDGWGMTDGDTVTVGGTTTRITNITGNSVTVADPVSWTNGMPVYWGTDTTPDIGALPYGSTELTAASLAQNGTTYTVSTTGDARGVWFYVNGIPTTWVSKAPYQTTISSGTVTAKAYALYAQANPVVIAGVGGNTPPTISLQPTSQTNVVGQTLTFAVGAGGIPAPSYIWQTNNGSGSFVNVANGGASSSWTTPNLVLGMNGWNVRVALTNLQGSLFSDTVRIGVTNGVAPVISSQPANTTAAVGGTTSFTVVASGGGLTYQWLLDGLAIPGATASVYTISNVTLAASGSRYSVVISNAWGTITSQVATLTVDAVWNIDNSWTTFGLASADDVVQFSFDAYVSHADADFGIGFSPNVVGNWTDLGPIILFDVSGVIYARNGGAYMADTPFTYAPNTWYHISGTANIVAHTYSVSVNGVPLANDYAFRSEQAGAANLSNFGATEAYSSLAVVSNLVWTPYVASKPVPPSNPRFGTASP